MNERPGASPGLSDSPTIAPAAVPLLPRPSEIGFADRLNGNA